MAALFKQGTFLPVRCNTCHGYERVCICYLAAKLRQLVPPGDLGVTAVEACCRHVGHLLLLRTDSMSCRINCLRSLTAVWRVIVCDDDGTGLKMVLAGVL